MRSNPFFNYLQFLIINQTHQFEILKKYSRAGKEYFYIPFSISATVLELTQYGRLNVTDSHLTCFPEITPESYDAVIHFTAHLQSKTQEIKFHVYWNKDNQVAGFYAKDMKKPERIPNLSFNDIKSIYNESLPFIRTITNQFDEIYQQLQDNAFKQNLKFQNLSYVEESELELQLAQLSELSETMKLLALLNPSDYRAQFQRIKALYDDHMQKLLSQEEFVPAHSEFEESSVIMSRPSKKINSKSPAEILINIREKLIVLEHVLAQKPKKMHIFPNKTLAIHTEYQTKFMDTTELFASFYENLINIEGLELNSQHQRLLSQLNKKIDDTQLKINEFYNEYFESMVLTNNYENIDLIFSFLHKPKSSIFIHIIRHQATDVLIRLLKKFNISVLERVFLTEPASIIEYVIHHRNEACFSAIISNVSINFLTELPDGRPLATLILDLNPANRLRMHCVSQLAQFNSKSFYTSLKSRLFELIKSGHPASRELLEIYKILDILKSSGITRPKGSQKMAQKFHQEHQKFFSDFLEDLEGMDFLKTERFLVLIQKYEGLAKMQEQRASVIKKTSHQMQSRSEFLNQFCTKEMKQRLKSIMVGMTEDDAYDAMTIAYEVALAHDRLFEIEDELQNSSLSLRAIKALLQEKRKLRIQIEELQHGSLPSRTESIRLKTAIKALVISKLSEEERDLAIGFLTQEVTENPIESYANLPGIEPIHLESMRQLREIITQYSLSSTQMSIEPVVACLDRLHNLLKDSHLSDGTLGEITQFYQCETQRIFNGKF